MRYRTSSAASWKRAKLIGNCCLVETLEQRRLLSTTFTNADLNDTWNLASMKESGNIQFDGAGHVTGGTTTKDDGTVDNPSGTYSINSTGAINAGEGGVGAIDTAKDVAALTKITSDNHLQVI